MVILFRQKQGKQRNRLYVPKVRDRPVLDFEIGLSCEPKDRFGSEGLLDRLRRVRRLRRQARLRGEETAEAQEAGYEIRPLSFHCAHCPANVAGREFGCFRIIRLPLSAEAEEWLIDLLPSSLRTPPMDTPAARQVEAVRDLYDRLRALEIDGAAVDGRRGDGLLVERRRPAVRKYGWRRDSIRITSSQLLELLLFHEADPETAERVCRALGIWEDGGVGEDGVPEVIFTQPAEETDSTSIAGLKRFFYALMIACSLDVPVNVWMEP
jgi:hypothetical protein